MGRLFVFGGSHAAPSPALLMAPHRPSVMGLLQSAVFSLAMVQTVLPSQGPVPVVWSSLVADEAGRIDYGRCKALASILLALGGGGVLVAASLGWAPFGAVRMEILTLSAASMIAPLTGGYVLELRKRKNEDLERVNQRVVGEIQAGARPGRRAQDLEPSATTGDPR